MADNRLQDLQQRALQGSYTSSLDRAKKAAETLLGQQKPLPSAPTLEDVRRRFDFLNNIQRTFAQQNRQDLLREFNERYRNSVSVARELLVDFLRGFASGMTGQQFKTLRQEAFEAFLLEKQMEREAQQEALQTYQIALQQEQQRFRGALDLAREERTRAFGEAQIMHAIAESLMRDDYNSLSMYFRIMDEKRAESAAKREETDWWFDLLNRLTGNELINTLVTMKVSELFPDLPVKEAFERAWQNTEIRNQLLSFVGEKLVTLQALEAAQKNRPQPEYAEDQLRLLDNTTVPVYTNKLNPADRFYLIRDATGRIRKVPAAGIASVDQKVAQSYVATLANISKLTQLSSAVTSLYARGGDMGGIANTEIVMDIRRALDEHKGLGQYFLKVIRGEVQPEEQEALALLRDMIGEFIKSKTGAQVTNEERDFYAEVFPKMWYTKEAFGRSLVALHFSLLRKAAVDFLGLDRMVNKALGGKATFDAIWRSALDLYQRRWEEFVKNPDPARVPTLPTFQQFLDGVFKYVRDQYGVEFEVQTGGTGLPIMVSYHAGQQ